MFTDIIILAGGFGERLWPASTHSFPKQFMSLEGGISFLQSTIIRAVDLKISGKIIVVTRRDIENIAIEQCKTLLEQTTSEIKDYLEDHLIILVEPEPVHTLPPIIAVSYFLKLSDPEINHSVLVMTSDHVIGPTPVFIEDTKTVFEAAKKNMLVCYAIPPTEPATGYGYIKINRNESILPNNKVFKIEQFKEKPDYITAKEYLETGNYYWNSGMFGFYIDFFLKEVELCVPTMFSVFKILENTKLPKIKKDKNIKIIDDWLELNNLYTSTQHVSIDTGIAEKTKNACAVLSSFSWEDIGTWDTFSSLFTKKQESTILIESSNCFTYSDIPVALCGVNDLIIVEKDGKLLVMKKGCSDLVKKAVHLFEDNK